MQPLLKIQTIPIKIEAQTKRASLQQSTDPAPVQQRPVQRPIQRPTAAPQRPKIDAQPLPDNRANQTRNTPQHAPAADNAAGSYLQEASDAVQAYNQNAAVSNIPVSDVASAPASSTEYQASATIEPAPAQSAVSTSFDYTMDRETFDWSTTSKPQLEYVPASIEYSIKQYPEVIIEYVGEPIYVPASANPNYVPPPEAKGKA